MGLLDRKTQFSSPQHHRPPTDGLTHNPLDHMDHTQTTKHLDPTAPMATSSATAIARVNAWLASLIMEFGNTGGAGGRGGSGDAALKLSLGTDCTPRGVAYLRMLAAAS